MGEKVEIINEHWCRSLLEKDDLDYSKFYRRQIEEFLDVSRKDNKKLQQRIDKAIEYLLNNKLYCFKYDEEELFEITTDKKAKDDLLNILQGSNKE